MVSGTISLPCSGCFSPFLHSTGSLSVSHEYLALPDGPGWFRQDFTCPALLRISLCIINLHVRDYHPLWSHFPMCSISFISAISWSYYPATAETMEVWAVPRSLAATGGITIVLFSCRYLDVSVPCVRLPDGIVHLQCTGLPHSETSGFTVICTYPELIAAYHVLHRLWEPRHPPYALNCFYNLYLLLSYIQYLYCILFVIAVMDHISINFPICQRT